jgi:hypothetical protein
VGGCTVVSGSLTVNKTLPKVYIWFPDMNFQNFYEVFLDFLGIYAIYYFQGISVVAKESYLFFHVPIAT